MILIFNILNAPIMRSGTGFAIIVVLGYVVFEGYAVHKASYRTEPAYIHNMLIEAKAAVEACDDGTKRDAEGFDRILMRVTEKYKGELIEQNPGKAVGDIDQEIADKALAAKSTIEAYVAEHGCIDQEVKNHQRRFDIYARKG